VSCAVPGRPVFLGYSFDGLGMTMTPVGVLDIENAARFATLVPTATGDVSLTFAVPDGHRGRAVWWQGIDERGNVTDIESAKVE